MARSPVGVIRVDIAMSATLSAIHNSGQSAFQRAPQLVLFMHPICKRPVQLPQSLAGPLATNLQTAAR